MKKTSSKKRLIEDNLAAGGRAFWFKISTHVRSLQITKYEEKTLLVESRNTRPESRRSVRNQKLLFAAKTENEITD